MIWCFCVTRVTCVPPVVDVFSVVVFFVGLCVSTPFVSNDVLISGSLSGVCTVWGCCVSELLVGFGGEPPGMLGGTGSTCGKCGIGGRSVVLFNAGIDSSGEAASCSPLVLLGVVCSPGDDILRFPVELVGISCPPPTCSSWVLLLSLWGIWGDWP